MNKYLKFLLLFIFVLVLLFVAIPEINIKKEKNEAISLLSKEAGYSPFLSKFIVNTKLGRKIAFLAIKKELKSKLKDSKKEIKSVIK